MKNKDIESDDREQDARRKAREALLKKIKQSGNVESILKTESPDMQAIQKNLIEHGDEGKDFIDEDAIDDEERKQRALELQKLLK